MMKRKHDDSGKKSKVSTQREPKSPKPKQTGGYFGDPRLIPRVRQYLTNHKGKKVINIAAMVDDLQKRYGEYGRKKRSAFFKSVEKAYQLLCEDSASDDNQDEDGNKIIQLEAHHLLKKLRSQSGDITSDEESDQKSFSSENADYVSYEDRNAVNRFLTDMYKNSPKAPVKSTTLTNTPEDEINARLTNSVPLRTGQLENNVSPIPSNETSRVLIDLPDSSQLEDSIRSSGSRANEADLDTSKNNSVPVTTPRRKSKTKTSDKIKDKYEKKDINVLKSSVTFADFGGNEACLKEICKLLVHMKHPEVYQTLGVTPPRGFLLHGPPGCGKTLLANAIAGELDLPFIKLAAPEIVSGVSGESEEKIRDLFEKAVSCAPCIMFIDEIDAITPKRETASKDMERRIVAQLLSCLDDLSSKSSAHVLVIGASNRPDSLDPALRRAGRFDREISLGIPDESARGRILQVLCRNLKLSDKFDFSELARLTPGFVGADLMALAREAAMTAVNRVFNDLQKCVEPVDSQGQITVGDNQGQLTTIETTQSTSEQDLTLVSLLSWLKDQPPLNENQLKDLRITMEDFQVIKQRDVNRKSAVGNVQPSAKREGFATIPDVTWEDIGALQSVRQELKLSILAPIRYKDDFKALGLTNPPGILLAGPPGCGKTLLAKAIANESGVNFISVKGPELLNMYVGESERAVRQVFQRARNSAPCVIFFDELDALCPRRSDTGEGGSSVRVVNQLLTEMDGLEERKQVFIMGATNRPDIIDPAILRPGRLDKLLYVGLPSVSERLDILSTITKNGSKPKLAVDVELSVIAEKSDGFSGADLAAIVRESCMVALKERIDGEVPLSSSIEVHKRHFEVAFLKVKPSVSEKDHHIYDRIKQRFQT